MSATADFFDAELVPLPTSLEEQANQEIPRDRYDRPLIWPVGTGPETHAKKDMRPYNRASSYGGQLEDKGALEKWGKRQMLRGAAIDVDRWRQEMAAVNRGEMRPELVRTSIIDRVPEGPARVRGGEPEFRDKKTLNQLVEQADEAVGSQDKAALGTAIHLATELIDQGDDLSTLSPLLRNRADAYYKATREWGLEYTAIERFGVEDVNEVAGTTDRAGYIPFWGRDKQRILDVKTSGSMDFAGIGFAVQLATYAHMAYYTPDGRREYHENMDLERAMIIHVSREMGGPVEFFEVNIAAGWQFAHLAKMVLLARRVGGKAINEITELEVEIMSAQSPQELTDLYNQSGNAWGPRERQAADQAWQRFFAPTGVVLEVPQRREIGS